MIWRDDEMSSLHDVWGIWLRPIFHVILDGLLCGWHCKLLILYWYPIEFHIMPSMCMLIMHCQMPLLSAIVTGVCFYWILCGTACLQHVSQLKINGDHMSYASHFMLWACIGCSHHTHFLGEESFRVHNLIHSLDINKYTRPSSVFFIFI